MKNLSCAADSFESVVDIFVDENGEDVLENMT